jgi:DNA-binding winged helix-turn-helix (wHTH) protein
LWPTLRVHNCGDWRPTVGIRGARNPSFWLTHVWPAAVRKLNFGPFELLIGERLLRRGADVLPLGGRALDILIYLAERPSKVISKQELVDHVWPDVTVEEGSLRVHVAAIRKALGDDHSGNRYIANIKGRGYSFVGSVVRLDESAAKNAHRQSQVPCPRARAE